MHDGFWLAPLPDARRKARSQPEIPFDTASTSTPASEDSSPPSNPTLTFLREPMEDRMTVG
jgi:hypothetical protein